MKTKSFALFTVLLFAGLLIMPSLLYAGDYVDTAKVTLRPQYVEKLKPIYDAWDKYAKDAMKLSPDTVAEIQAKIAIAESYADENDMDAFEKEMKKLKSAEKDLKKAASVGKTYFQ
jgi:hypothetical protein